MHRLSGRTKGNYFLVILWLACAVIDIHNGENYGGIIFKFFAAAVFAGLATYYLLIDLKKAGPLEKRKGKWLAISAIIAVLLAAFVLLGNYDVEMDKYNVKSEKIPQSFDGFRIAQVSDLHNAQFDKYNAAVLEPIFLSRPDIIVITGDMIDSRRTNVKRAISFAEKAVNIAPVYYANGNHEERLPKEYDELKKGLQNAGVTILENASADITIGDETITLTGLNDPAFEMEIVDDSAKKNIASQLERAVPKNDNYKILLAHRPEHFDVYSKYTDLVFSGHAHGGQFILPFIGGLIAPGQGFFPKCYEGSHTKNGAEMLISRGLGSSILPLRINNKPQIVIAELTKLSD